MVFDLELLVAAAFASNGTPTPVNPRRGNYGQDSDPARRRKKCERRTDRGHVQR